MPPRFHAGPTAALAVAWPRAHPASGDAVGRRLPATTQLELGEYVLQVVLDRVLADHEPSRGVVHVLPGSHDHFDDAVRSAPWRAVVRLTELLYACLVTQVRSVV